MIARLKIAALLIVLSTALLRASSERTFYVDCADGNDTNTGLTLEKAWKTLDKVNASTFGPGDRLLLKSGCAWRGHLAPQGSGAANLPIVIDRFGGEARPCIDAEGGQSTNSQVSANIYFGNIKPIDDAQALVADPLLVDPGHGANGRDTLGGYQLRSNSPAIDSGLQVPSAKQKDFFGGTVPACNGVDRGAVEFQHCEERGK